jgi:hypothetical protein
LQAAARTSSFYFKGKGVDLEHPRAIAFGCRGELNWRNDLRSDSLTA